MSEAKFSPGPWNVRTVDGSIGTVDAGHVTVAQAQEVSAADRNAGHVERKANTRLIAAAPTLLNAAMRVDSAFAAYPFYSEALVELRAAIAAALGSPQ